MAEPTPTPTPAPTPESPTPATSPTPSAAPSPTVEARKKAIDPEKRERDAAEAQVRREVKALAKEKDAAKLRAAAAKMREVRGAEAPSQAKAEAPAEASPTSALATAEPGQLPGWPKPSEISAQEGTMAHLWAEARRALPARYARVLEVRVEKGELLLPDGKRQEVEVTINPIVTLSKGTAPLAAQLLGKVNAMTPSAAAAVAVGTVFLRTFIEHRGELLFGGPAPAAVGATASPAPAAQA